jgi:adenylate cyclase
MSASAAERVCVRFAPAGAGRILEKARAKDQAKVEKPVAVLFVDIVGCARVCEELPLHTTNALIEAYFARFFDVVQGRRGIVNEIMGDGFMAVFERGRLRANAADALAAAGEILHVTSHLRARGQHDTQVHIGLHAGTASWGSLAFGRGSGSAGPTRLPGR